ncbi:metallophosphoesterase [Candidatus Roizmanbacteria bacterium]|nr:MAG: metallophosphoesterase [Candidatus Roizmanbacteria bacterium]
MKFVIVNDIHNGPSDSGFHKGIQRKLTFMAEGLVQKFVETMNSDEKPEFVVNLGDFIEDVNNREVDMRYFRETVELLLPLRMPVYSLIGNHDVRTLTDDDMKKILNYDQLYYSFDHGGFHFIALSFTMTGNHKIDLDDIKAEVLSDQLKWLHNDLSSTTKPTIVFIHYGLADDDLIGNFWFESKPEYGLLHNRADVRKILEASGKVKAVISGHQHWNRMKVHNGIPYFVVTSLVENFRNDGTPTEAHTVVTLDEKGIEIDVKGNDPTKFHFEFE